MPYFLLVLLAVVALFIRTYNRLVADRALVNSAWSDIDVQLKRRHDLIPQLLSAVSGYADYEKATLTAVTELRARSDAASALPQKAAAEDALGLALHQLIGLVESYPDLKANEQFVKLQESLVETEDYLQKARRFYNGAARNLNVGVRSFPNVLIAAPLGFEARDYFEVSDESERRAPRVEI